MKPLAIVLLIGSAAFLRAEIKTQEKDQVQFAGAMGRMMSIFGGKAMREGVIDTVAVKGNRKITVNDATGRIIDLDEEKVYELDMKAKTYKVLTFDDMRRQFEQAQQRAKNTEEKTHPAADPKTDEPKTNPDAKQVQIDFDLKESGQKKTINGYDSREVVITIAVHEKDKTLEQSGGMVMTTHEWLATGVPSTREIADFDRRYNDKLYGPIAVPAAPGMPSADQMAAAAAMYPMLTQAIGRFNAESVNMEGTPVLISMTTESVASPEQLQQEQQKTQPNDSSASNIPTSVSGLVGALGRRALRNRTQQQQQDTTPGRATIMTVNHELLKVATDLGAGDLAIPPGFKQK